MHFAAQQFPPFQPLLDNQNRAYAYITSLEQEPNEMLSTILLNLEVGQQRRWGKKARENERKASRSGVIIKTDGPLTIIIDWEAPVDNKIIGYG